LGLVVRLWGVVPRMGGWEWGLGGPVDRGRGWWWIPAGRGGQDRWWGVCSLYILTWHWQSHGFLHLLCPIPARVAQGEKLARDLLDHGVVIELCAHAAFMFVALKWGGVRAVVARWVVPVVVGRLVWGLRVQGEWLGVEPGGWWIPAVIRVVALVVV
jgi:hypothetical protein